MILRKVVIQNFQSFRTATVFLEDRGLVSIDGVTNDKDGADSNGAGKSTLINAILWCNYGDAGKKIDGVDDVVNTDVGKDCFVSCEWYDETTNVSYTITRFRKHKTFKNSVRIVRETASMVEQVDLSKGTDGETQKLINEILGADKPTFEADCFARQKDAPEIPAMTDKELKALLEKVLPFEDISGRYDRASKVRNKQLSFVSELKSELTQLEVRKIDVQTDLQAEEVSARSWLKMVADRNENRKRLIKLNEEEIAGWSRDMISQTKIDAALAKFQKLVDDYDDTPRQRHLADVRVATKGVDILRRDVASVANKCPTCDRDFDDYEQAVAVANASLAKAKATLSKLQEKDSEFGAAWTVFGTNADKLEKVKLMQRTQERMLNNINRCKDEISRLQGDIDAPAPNPHLAAVERLSERLQGIDAEILAYNQQITQEEAELELLESVVEMYSPKGVRYHILETVTPALNASTNKYLSQLTDGKLKAIWSTVSKLKSGEFREKFSITVTGGKAPGYGSLSGGEQRKVRLACFFALQDLIAKRATKSIKLWCGDEIDDALDTAGLERLMSLLHEKAKKKKTILVISHNELREWIPHFSTVTKTDDVSVITGYLCDSKDQ